MSSSGVRRDHHPPSGLALLAAAHRISCVETRGSWVYLYDDSGHRYKTLSVSSVGEVKGYSSGFFVSRNGAWIYTWNREGRKVNTRSAR